MIIKHVSVPHNSFMSVEKDLSLIVDWMLKDDNLCKLLYHTTPDVMKMPRLTQEQKNGMINKQIKIVPKVYVDRSVLAYVIISMDSFTPNSTNEQFRDNLITFDIICHFDQWNLGNYQLRPYRIAAELDTMFDNQHLTGIGELHFVGMNQIVLNDEFAGLSLVYQAIHGGEDKKTTANPTQQQAMVDNFNELFNNKK